MAEIAADVGLSVGSLYLEFRSKEDILAALTEETAGGFEREFRRILESDLPASRKLREVLRARVQLSDRCCREGAHAGEVLLAGLDRCARTRSAKEERYLEIMERILREGVQTGDLDVADPAICARVLRDAISIYLPPYSLRRESGGVIVDADRLIDLLIRGLQPQLQKV